MSGTGYTGRYGMELCSGFLHQTQPDLNYLIIDISGAQMKGGPFEVACQKIGYDIISVMPPRFYTYEVKTEKNDPYGNLYIEDKLIPNPEASAHQPTDIVKDGWMHHLACQYFAYIFLTPKPTLHLFDWANLYLWVEARHKIKPFKMADQVVRTERYKARGFLIPHAEAVKVVSGSERWVQQGLLWVRTH
jgi:hypothetical protein